MVVEAQDLLVVLHFKLTQLYMELLVFGIFLLKLGGEIGKLLADFVNIGLVCSEV